MEVNGLYYVENKIYMIKLENLFDVAWVGVLGAVIRFWSSITEKHPVGTRGRLSETPDSAKSFITEGINLS